MRGTKRLATSSSELAPESNDTAMRTKRAMAAFFDIPKGQKSQQQVSAAMSSSLDVQRAESSRQHVRALNTQFASWVQTQLKNHPDELWEDGLRDYLAHASSIMEKFSDVVTWLKVNAAKGGPGAESSASDKKSSPETSKRNENNLFSEKPPAFASTSTSFTTAAWPSAMFSNNQSSGAVSSSKNSGSLLSNSQSSGMFSGSQSSGVFSGSQSSAFPPNSQTPGLFSSSQSTGVSSNSQLGSSANNQSAGLFSKSQTQSSGLSSNSQGAGLFSKSQTQSSGVLSNSQGAGLFSKSQTQSSGLLSNSQGAGLFSNSQSQTSGSLSNSQGAGLFSNSQTPTFGSSSSSQGGNLFSSSSGSALFSNSQSTGFFSSSPSSGLFSGSPSSGGGFSSTAAPIFFGSQIKATTNNNASDDADDGDELPQPGSPSVKKAEEKGVVLVHEVKCKLYVKSIDPADKDTWKDKGPGQLSIKCAEGVSKGTKESNPTLIVRNDVGKVLLNALIYPGIKTNLQKNSVVAIFHVAADDSGSSDSAIARTFLIRTKTEDDRDKLATAIREYAPESRM